MHRSWLVLALLVACGGDPNTGDACDVDADCTGDLACDLSLPGGYCTVDCTMQGSSEECPEGSVCDQLVGVAAVCAKICEVQADCRDDQECNGLTGSDVKACKPKP